MKRVLVKYKSLLNDVIINAIAFCIYTFAQQILLLPILSKILDKDSYASLVIFISLLNLVCSVLGGQLGAVREIRNLDYKKEKSYDDFRILLKYISILVFVFMFLALLIMKYPFYQVILLSLLALLTNIRFYIQCFFRIKEQYTKLVKQNICYLVGISLGLYIAYITNNFIFPLLIGELLAFIYVLFNTNIINKKLNRTPLFKTTIKKYFYLSSASLLSNSLTFIDKIIVFPLLGPISLAAYYAGTTLSKIIYLIINPINSVLLVKLSNSSNNGLKIISKVLELSIPLVIIISLINIPVIYLSSLILYGQYLNIIKGILIYLSIACAFDTITSIMNSLVLRYAESHEITIVYIIHIIIFTICGIVGAKYFGLKGFVISSIITKFELWLSFIVLLIINRNKIIKREKTIV